MSDKKDSVVSLAERREVPHDPDAIARLEECLKLAKEDGVDSFAIAMVCNAGTVITSYSCKGDVYTLIGAIEAVRQRFIDKRIIYDN